MARKRSRRGIEWKILKYILAVGIIPITVAGITGYYAARLGRANEVETHLAFAAKKTAEGVHFAISGRSAAVAALAGDDRILEFLKSFRSGADSARAQLQQHLATLNAGTGELNSTIRIYDMQGNPLVTSDGSVPEKLPNAAIATRTPIPELWTVEFDRAQGHFMMTVGARIQESESNIPLGYISQSTDADPLIDFVFGEERGPTAPQSSEVYRIVFSDAQGNLAAYYLGGNSAADTTVPASEPLDPQLAELMRNSSGTDADGLNRVRVEMASGPRIAYAAFARVRPGVQIFVLVYRTTDTIFPEVNWWAAAAIGVSFLFMMGLSLGSYMLVHNSIARPLELLNEGAQIIRHGDLELKLKISTADELEDLANSFNEMALALKAKMLELEQSEERYRSLVTSMRDGIFQSDTRGTLEFLNPAGKDLFGIQEDESIQGVNLRQLFHDPTEFEHVMNELERKGFLERTRIWMRRRDRRAICVELTANRMYGDEGVVIGTEGIFRDVTKNIRLEQEAHERLERITAINQIANAINSSLEAGRLYESLVVEMRKFVDFDSANLTLFRAGDGQIEIRTLWPVTSVPPRDQAISRPADACSEWVAREKQCLVVKNFSEVPDSFSEIFPDGTVSCICVPLYATGRIIGAMNMGSKNAGQFTKHDVEVIEQLAPHAAVAIRNAQLLENLQASLEEVTRAREKLHDANEELKTLDEMKTNLLSNVSHELRTPLVAVMGYTDMIRSGKTGPINDTQKDYLEICLRNIDRLVTLIENLLDFSRLNRGTETVVFDTIDLLDCARAAIEQVKPVVDSREIKVELVAPDSSVMIEGDKAKLIQVINNLLSNAVKFNHNGGRVNVEIRVTPDTAEVTVSDTGIGIPAEALDKVFTRFYQYDSSSTRKYGGTGIGLSIAQDIVRLHGGRISVSSEVDVGSEFRFTLSRKAASRAVEEGPAETHMLVELVSSDRALTAHVRGLLETEGIHLLSAGNESHAVSLAAKHKPDCVLVDIEQFRPGTTVIDELLADPQTGLVPIILLSSSDELFAKYRSMLASRVKRGFRKSTLLSAIRVALNREAPSGEPLGEKILCVDDDAEILVFMARCLEQGGFTAETCDSGAEALEKIASREYNLVLMDIAMPGLDGWEVCRRIKSDSALAGCKVCMVTAKPTESTRNSNMQNSADGYLLKPFRPEDLLDLVRGMGAVPHNAAT
jgi:PAS domain S-box-containing protein